MNAKKKCFEWKTKILISLKVPVFNCKLFLILYLFNSAQKIYVKQKCLNLKSEYSNVCDMKNKPEIFIDNFSNYL